MKNEIKNYDSCAKQAYVPASVKVIELTSQRGMCVLTGSTVKNPFGGGGNEEEW